MSYFDDASLVMIPSGYKTSKVYSVKPTDGTGDLAFTRSNDTATRVGADGLIEKVITNTFTHSENFPNAVWAKTNVAITADTTTAPNGTLTADSMLSNTISNVDHMVRFTTSMAVSTEHTASFYAKQIVTRYAYIRDLTNNEASVFDLQDGVVSFQAASHTAKIVVDGSFYRVSITFQTPAVIPNNLIDLGCTTSSTGITSVVPIGEGIAIWGAMLQTGVLTPYIPTTTAAVSVGMLANVPRLDYLGSTCPRLLLEPQRTNLATFSEQLNNAAWGKTNITITANNATSPDGYQNADTCLADGVSAVHIIASNLMSFTSGTAYSFSVLAKKGTNNFMQLIISSTVGGMFANFDLNNGTVGTLGTLTGATPTSSIVDYGNGWYRCVMNFIPTATTSAYANFVIVTSASAVRAESNALATSVFLWGCQLEAGAYATSYIPTLGAAVTRGAEKASKSSINALIGGTSGTIFFEIKTNKTLTGTNYKTFVYYTDVSAAQMYIYLDGNNTLITSPTLGNIVASVNLAADTTYKVAVAYATNDIKLYINGVERGSSVSATPINALNILSIGSHDGTSEFNEFTFLQYLHFKTRLSNAQLAELTA